MDQNNIRNRPIRWGIVIGAVAIVCIAVFLVCAVWYLTAIVIPHQKNLTLSQIMAGQEFDALTNQILKIDSVLRLPFGRHTIPVSP